MNSKELREAIKTIENQPIICWTDADIDKRLNKIMSLLSKNCWLKDTVTGVGEKKFEVVKPIEEIKE